MSLLPCHEILDNRVGWKSITALNFSLAFCDVTDALHGICQKGSLGWSGVISVWSCYLAPEHLKPQLFHGS